MKPSWIPDENSLEINEHVHMGPQHLYCRPHLKFQNNFILIDLLNSMCTLWKCWSGAVLIDKLNGIIGIDTGYVGNTMYMWIQFDWFWLFIANGWSNLFENKWPIIFCRCINKCLGMEIFRLIWVALYLCTCVGLLVVLSLIIQQCFFIHKSDWSWYFIHPCMNYCLYL